MLSLLEVLQGLNSGEHKYWRDWPIALLNRITRTGRSRTVLSLSSMGHLAFCRLGRPNSVKPVEFRRGGIDSSSSQSEDSTQSSTILIKAINTTQLSAPPQYHPHRRVTDEILIRGTQNTITLIVERGVVDYLCELAVVGGALGL